MRLQPRHWLGLQWYENMTRTEDSTSKTCHIDIGIGLQFLSIWTYFYDRAVDFPQESNERKRERERGKLKSLLNLILGVTYHFSCLFSLGLKTNFRTVWKGNVWECGHQNMEIVKGLLGIWPPHILSEFIGPTTQAHYPLPNSITQWWEGNGYL